MRVGERPSRGPTIFGVSPVEQLERGRRFIVDGLWAEEGGTRGLPGALLRFLQLAVLIAREFVRDELLLRASALAYMTSLSLVPILVLLLSTIQWLGLSRDLAAMAVDNLLAGSPSAIDAIMGVVETANVGALGSLGAATFLVVTILSLRHVEETLNDIWGVRQRRSWVRRFTNYLAVLVVVPLLLGTAISLAPTLRNAYLEEQLIASGSFELVRQLLAGGAPTGFFFASFSLLYWLLPNTGVRIVSALLGGAIAAVLFSAAQGIYVSFSVGVARYDALFGGFAALPLLLVWIYISWSIVLMGAEIAYAHQHLARFRQEIREHALGTAAREAIGLKIAIDVARSFRDRTAPQRPSSIADRVGASLGSVSDSLEALQQAGIVSACQPDGGDIQFQLGRPAEDIAIAEVLQALRGDRRTPGEPDEDAEQAGQVVESLLAELDLAGSQVASRTLAEVLLGLSSSETPGGGA